MVPTNVSRGRKEPHDNSNAGCKLCRVMTMDALFAITLIGSLFVLPLVLRIWSDRRQARAGRIGAEIRAAVNRRLGGESLLSVQVRPAGLLHSGRVVLNAPSGCLDLAETVWPVVAPRVPDHYDLVVKPRRARGAASKARELSRAA
jgi:hypothetical protein